MGPDAKKVDLFGSFLAASQRAGGDAAAPAPPIADRKRVEGELTSLLAGTGEPVPVRDLIGHTQCSPTEVLTILADLEKFGLAARHDLPGGLAYQITDLGRDLAS